MDIRHKRVDKLVHQDNNIFSIEYCMDGLMLDTEHIIVHMARLSAGGKTEDVAALFRKTVPSLVKQRPDLTDDVAMVLGMLDATRLARSTSSPLPVDLDSRLELLRRESNPTADLNPVWPESVATVLSEVIEERALEHKFLEAGIEPTKSLLFHGAPGTGKTLAATWLAEQLQFPLLTLDLSAVMSSFLGRTGNNIRVVLDFARRSQGVLLLDEFDAIAKRRDDGYEIGELKRLVTVLLQEIESWPAHSILIAATNHPDLLDPAVWRRFDRVIDFPFPSTSDVETLVCQLFPIAERLSISANLLACLFDGHSFADVTRTIDTAKRTALVHDIGMEQAVVQIATNLCRSKSQNEKLSVARLLNKANVSQRRISYLTGLSRDTLRKRLGSPKGISSR